MNRRQFSLAAVLATLFMASAGVALAAPAKDAVKVNLQVFKVSTVDGKETLVDGKTAKPGEILEYQATYSNVSSKSVDNLVATLPVPSGMAYVQRSARPISAEASVDGTNFAPVPLIRKKAGGVGSEPVPVEDYRALRWQLTELQAGKSVTVSARVKVSGPGA